MPAGSRPQSAVSWGLGMEHEFLPASLDGGVWHALKRSDMVAMVKDQNKRNIEVAKSPGLLIDYDQRYLVRLVQPIKNHHPCVKTSTNVVSILTPNYEEVESDSMIRVHVRSPDGTLAVFTPAQETALQGAKVIVVCQAEAWRVSVTIIPDPAGAVYDFKLLNADVAKATQHLWKKPMDESHVTTPPSVPFTMDSGFIEVSSKAYKNASVESIAREIRRDEDVVLKASASYLKSPTILPHCMAINKIATYAGSYHVWLTLPHGTGKKFDHHAFIRDHRRASIALQWVEPLLFGCMAGDPRAPGAGHKYSRASMRHGMNYLSGLGVTTIPSPQPKAVLVYASLEALNSGEAPAVKSVESVWEVTKNGELVDILACVCQGRIAGMDAVEGWWHRLTPSTVQNFGVDIRFDSCTGIGLPSNEVASVSGHPKRAVVMHKGKAWLASSKKDGTFQLRAGSKLKPAGFEFRMFDHFPSEHAPDLLKTVVTVTALAYHPKASKLDTAIEVDSNVAWIQQVSNSAMYGSRGPVDAKYWASMRSALGLSPSRPPATIYAALNVCLKDTFLVMKGSSTLNRFGVDSPATFPDANFAIWRDAVAAQKGATQRNLTKLAAAASIDVGTVRAVMGAGWAQDTYALRALMDRS